jgi:hypothetical protein
VFAFGTIAEADQDLGLDLGTNWIGAGEERMGQPGRMEIVAPAPAGRRAGLRFCIQNHEGCGADGRKKRNQLAN